MREIDCIREGIGVDRGVLIKENVTDHLKNLTRDEGTTAIFVYNIIHYCILLSTKRGHRCLTDSQSHARVRIVKQS